MNNELSILLQSADDPDRWEAPRHFRWKKEIADVRGVKPKLEEIINHELEMDMHVQDATFFTELSWQAAPRHVVGFGSVVLTYVAIRFSAFGRFTTIWGNVPEAPIEPRTVSQLTVVLRNAGYTNLSAEDVAGDYDGCHRGAPEDATWWDRYFDYS